MPASERIITAADIIPDAEFRAQRSERRRELLPRKKLRRIEVGPVCTFYFETFDTMLFQVQEMLAIEKGGAEQLKDELAAYNPMIPQGSELTATIMFEIDDPKRRASILSRLGGVEDCFFLQIGTERIAAEPEGDVERTDESGKSSSVHFVHFKLKPEPLALFRDRAYRSLAGVDAALWACRLSPATRAATGDSFS
ncbi:MAG: DUF3501 family protein [Hyphomonadaceae bacterium]